MIRRTIVKGVRLTRRELAAIQRGALAEGIPLAAFIRARLLAGLEVRGEPVPKNQTELPWEPPLPISIGHTGPLRR